MTAKAEQKARTREAILDAAVARIRERGFEGVSVAEVMAGAGLTVGGFYAHFDSKDALCDAAIARAAERARGHLRTIAERAPNPAGRAAAYARAYLSRAHRDHPDEGCPLPSTAGDVARAGPPLKAAFARELDADVDILAAFFGGAAEDPEARAQALGLLAASYGGLSLARALGPTALSDEVLRATRRFCEAALGQRAESALRPAPAEHTERTEHTRPASPAAPAAQAAPAERAAAGRASAKAAGSQAGPGRRSGAVRAKRTRKKEA